MSRRFTKGECPYTRNPCSDYEHLRFEVARQRRVRVHFVAYQLPYSAMIISAAAVMLLTFATMRYSKNKLKKVSIVEVIRSETV